MNPDDAMKIVNEVMLLQRGHPLKDIESHVLKESIAGKKYRDMGRWSPGSLKDAGARIWKCLSEEVGYKVTKSNFREAIEQLSQDSRFNMPAQLERQNILENPRVMPSNNPFGHRGRIEDPKHFFDREDILRQIFEGLHQGCSQSLVGICEVGKSSILWMVCLQGKQRLPSHNFIYLDMQCIDNEKDFFTALCQELQIIPTCRVYELNRKLRDKRYVLCLDEIEKMTDSSNFSGNERSSLRGLAEGSYSPLTLVTASRSPLSKLFPDSPEKTSPLTGIFSPQITVGPFSSNIALSFINYRLEGTGISFTEAQINDLIDKSKGHPARLQEYAAELYRQFTK